MSWVGVIAMMLLCLTNTIMSVKGFSVSQLRPHRHLVSCSMPSKWDDLVDEDDEPFIPPDMKYVPRNVMRQHQNFCDIKDAGGDTNDIYVRKPQSQVFWFCGKVARVSDVSLQDCIARQWGLIEHHACNLQPLELFPKRGTLEIWTAPGDSELDVAYNKPDLIFEKMERNDRIKLRNILIGFQGEVYTPEEQMQKSGFRTWRTEDGRAAKPEIKTPSEGQQQPTQEEMDRLLKTMDGMDIQELYKEQEKREGRTVED